MSDTSRVETWLRAHGRTNMTEWDRQPAIDGGNKVTRLARCIGDLKAKGLPIPPAKRIKIGNCWVAEYRLTSLASIPERNEPTETTDALFSAAQCAIDDDWDTAA